MTSNKQLLNNYKESTEGMITFGDGNKGAILGRGDLVLKNLPMIKDLKCLVNSADGCSILSGIRSSDNCYMLNNNQVCTRVSLDKSYLWHYRLGHLNYRDLKRLIKLKAVRGVSELKVSRERVCSPCQQGKQVRSAHPPTKMLLTTRFIELMHVDLMGHMQTECGKRYVMVCVDDYTRFTWVQFIREKSDTFGVFSALCLRLQNEEALKIAKVFRIRSDPGKEFENALFSEFCDYMGIVHEFSAPQTPQKMELWSARIEHYKKWPKDYLGKFNSKSDKDDYDNDEDNSVPALVPRTQQVPILSISSSPSTSSSTKHTEPSDESEDVVVGSLGSKQSVESSH
ncbi:uncharacterized protein LOC133778898 [Humulus lupulus]|uniref:uncharacterized protein LOC133778898 n=1 Tax=Humulus lupulus TaxID=3486 RepID=UPI002B405584|nr:uncharacterized protein LOC133778898 [Humulus lupulus]